MFAKALLVTYRCTLVGNGPCYSIRDFLSQVSSSGGLLQLSPAGFLIDIPLILTILPSVVSGDELLPRR